MIFIGTYRDNDEKRDYGFLYRKINFVDENDVVVGFDIEQDCCETVGYVIVPRIMAFASIENLYCVDSIVDDDGNEIPQPDLSGWVFDQDFVNDGLLHHDLEDGHAVAFRMVKDGEEQFLILYNQHNGYYGHGFTVDIGGVETRTGVL